LNYERLKLRLNHTVEKTAAQRARASAFARCIFIMKNSGGRRLRWEKATAARFVHVETCCPHKR